MSGPSDLARLAVTIDTANELLLSDQIKMMDVGDGVMRPTNAKAIADLAAQMSGALIYTSVSLGLSGTPNNGYFSVISLDSKNYIDVYRNSAGAAVLAKSYPSTEFVEEVGNRIFISGSNSGLIPVAATEAGQVPIWLENGLLGAVNLTPALRQAATKEVVTRFSLSDALMLPLMVNESGQVVVWLEKGRVNAAGLHATIKELAQAAIDSFEATLQSKVTDGSGLYSYRAKIASALGGIGFARVVFTGDSWTEHLAETAQPLSAALYNAYGQSGQGWISLHADEGGSSSTLSQLLNGARLIKSAGWTLADMTVVADSLDGHAVFATGTAATISITNLKTQSLKWYYKDGDGSFRYSVDGGAPITIACTNTGLRKSIDITGLTDAVHSIVFDLVGNPGTVTMYGGMATRTAPGVEFSKAGNGGSTATQWKVIAPYIQSYAGELKPDVAIIVLGTNDKNQGISKASFKSSLRDLVTAYKTGAPNCCVLLVTPTMGGSSPDLGLIAQYAEAMHELSQESTQVEYLNLNAFMPPRSVTDALGLWNDSNHLSEAGGRFVTGLLMKYLLKTN